MASHSRCYRITKMRNARKAEGQLRNLHLELVEVARPLTSLHTQRAAAASELMKWADSQNEAVQRLLSEMSVLEERSASKAEEFSGKYIAFCEVFQEILLQKEHLHGLKEDLRKAKLQVISTQKKFTDAQAKHGATSRGDTKNLLKRERAMTAAQQEFERADQAKEELTALVSSKMLEVQIILHDRLRSAYYALAMATMDYLHNMADLQEEVLRTVAIFPKVASVTPEGEFTYEPYPSPPGPMDVIWHHGEKLAHLLDLERADASDQVDKMRRRHMDEIWRTEEEMTEKEKELRSKIWRAELRADKAEKEIAALRTQKVTGSIMQAQIGIEDATHVQELGLAEYLFKRIQMAETAVTQLSEQLQYEIDNDTDIEYKASAFGLTINAVLLATAGYAQSSQAEKSLELMPMASEVANTAREFIALAVPRVDVMLQASEAKRKRESEELARTPKKEEKKEDKGSKRGSAVLADVPEKEEPTGFPAGSMDFGQPGDRVSFPGAIALRNGLLSGQGGGKSRPVSSISGSGFKPARKAPPPPKNGAPAGGSKLKRGSGGGSKPSMVDVDVQSVQSLKSAQQELESHHEGESTVDDGVPTPRAPATSHHDIKLEDSEEIPRDRVFSESGSLYGFSNVLDSNGHSRPGSEVGSPDKLAVPSSTPSSPAKPAQNPTEINFKANTLKKQLAALAEFAREVQRRDNELRGLARLAASDIEHNVSTAEQMLNHADERLKKFKLRSLDADSGRFLETNQAMIASAVELLAAVRQLIQGSMRMRSDLGKRDDGGRITEADFVHKHGKWVDSFSQVTKEVIDALPLLLEAMDQVTKGKGRHEEQQVAARTISSTTAQLVASSRNKTVPAGCTSDKDIAEAGERIIAQAHHLLAATRDSQNLALAGVLVEDFEHLTDNQAKRLVMATRVQVLKLESDLQKEREKLGRLQRLGYVQDM